MGRRSGGSRKPVENIGHLTELHRWSMPSMAAAVAMSKRQPFARMTNKDRARLELIGNRPLDGDAKRLSQAWVESEKLIADAIAYDARLARRSQWVRRDEGEHVDSGLLAEGDDQPFYKRTKATVNESTKDGKPVKILISTDDNDIVPGTAAAFIATARIVQQFMPLEIWWQGAWLTSDRCRGFVFQVPLVMNDGDFSRLEFCIADGARDTFSWLVMTNYALSVLHVTQSGCKTQAQRAYSEGHFVSHSGISPEGHSVAGHAARWIGLEPMWYVNCEAAEAENSAAQSLPPIRTKSTPYVPTPEDDRRMKEYEQQQKRLEEAKALKRLAAV